MRQPTVHAIGTACALLLASPATAQRYTGTYTLASPQGGSVTLVLQHGADGQLTGSMSGNGTQFQVEGIVEEGTAMGAITSGEGGVFFEATLEGDQLTLVLIEVGAGNMPDYSKARTLVLRRGGGTGGGVAPGPGPEANPLAGGGGDPVVGSFTGDGIALTLSGSSGAYQGTLVFQGTSYPAEARGQGGRLEGTFTTGGQRYPFTAVVQGGAMRLESAGTSYTLARQGAAPATNPLAGGVAGAGQPATGSGTLLGQWRCQTPQGMAQLSFLSDRELIYNGERSPYQLGQGVLRVPGDWGPQEYGYAINGDQLTVTNPDGSVTQCQRQQGQGGGAAGGGMEALLQGPRCAYSSSPDGGYSTLYKLFFDGQGRFVSGTESSFSGDPGSAYGLHNDPNAGTYQVTGNTKGSAVHLTFPDGSTGVAYVYFIDDDNGRILELRLNGRHYAPGLCQ